MEELYIEGQDGTKVKIEELDKMIEEQAARRKKKKRKKEENGTDTKCTGRTEGD